MLQLCFQFEKEAERVSSLKNAKHTPTLAEQYSRFIPVQVFHSLAGSCCLL